MSLATSHLCFSCPFINLEVERIRHDSAGVLQYQRQRFSRHGERQKHGKGERCGGLYPTATAHTTTCSSAPLMLPLGGEQKHSWRGLRKKADRRGWLSAPRCSSLFFLPLLPLSSSCWCCSFLPHSRSKRLEETVRNRGSSYKLTDATAWFLSRAPSSFDLHCLLRLLRAVLTEVAELHMDEVGTEKCGCLGAKAGY